MIACHVAPLQGWVPGPRGASRLSVRALPCRAAMPCRCPATALPSLVLGCILSQGGRVLPACLLSRLLRLRLGAAVCLTSTPTWLCLFGRSSLCRDLKGIISVIGEEAFLTWIVSEVFPLQSQAPPLPHLCSPKHTLSTLRVSGAYRCFRCLSQDAFAFYCVLL
jgi:hypothetical protein